MNIEIKKYAHMKDGRTIIIESVIEENRKYRGRLEFMSRAECLCPKSTGYLYMQVKFL